MPSITQVASCQPSEGQLAGLLARNAGRECRTVDLIRRMRDPSCPTEERLRLRELAVRLNLSYARHYGHGYRNRGESLADLQQVASLALVKAIDGYDPDRGKSFTGYATPTILGELKRHFRDRVWSLHVPRALQETSLTVTRARADLTQRLQRTPSVADIATDLDLPEEHVRAAEASAHAYHADSLNLPVRSDDSCRELQDLLGGPDEALESACDRTTLHAHIDRLPAHARYVLDRYFFGNRTQVQIAREVGASQMSVSRLLASSLATLREAFRQDRPGPNAKPEAGRTASSCRVSDAGRECIVVPSTAVLDGTDLTELREVLLDVVMTRRPRMLIVDMRHVREAPARIVRVLVDAYRAGGAVRSRLSVVNLTPELHRLLTTMTVTRLFACTTRGPQRHRRAARPPVARSLRRRLHIPGQPVRLAAGPRPGCRERSAGPSTVVQTLRSPVSRRRPAFPRSARRQGDPLRQPRAG